jgi:hypothetical protein
MEEKSDDLTAGSAPTASQEMDHSGKNSDLDDLFSKYKKLQQQLEFLEVQEEYIKDEQRNLKKEYLHAQEEVRPIGSPGSTISLEMNLLLLRLNGSRASLSSSANFSRLWIKTLELWARPPDQTIMCEFCLPSTGSCSSPRPRSPCISILTPSLTFCHQVHTISAKYIIVQIYYQSNSIFQRLIRPSQCCKPTRSLMWLIATLVVWTCRSRR